jgi:hypothetical protein
MGKKSGNAGASISREPTTTANEGREQLTFSVLR